MKISVEELKRLGSGATFAEVSKTQVSEFSVPLPPLPEQHRIAGILREQMGAVERARVAAQAQLDAAEALQDAAFRSAFGGAVPLTVDFSPGRPLPGWQWRP